jgi:prolyl oligopeptidase
MLIIKPRFSVRLLFAIGLANLISNQTRVSAADANANAGSPLTYPPARSDSHVDDYHGEKVADPYRWMEELDSPETKAWVKGEAELTDWYLEKVAARKALKERLTKLLDFEKFGTPFHAGKRYFYSHNSGLQPQSDLLMTDGLEGESKLAFSPTLLPKGVALAGYVASPDGKVLAYGLSQGGSDWTDWHFRELKSGKDLPDVLRWTKYYHPVFAPNGKGIYYSAFPAPAPGEELRVRDLNNAIYYHAFGTDASKDRKVYARPEHPDWQFQPHLTRGSRWLVITAGEGEVGDKGLENVYALDANVKNSEVVTLVEGFDAEYLYVGADDRARLGGALAKRANALPSTATVPRVTGSHLSDTVDAPKRELLFFQTTLNAPKGRVIAMDPDAAQPQFNVPKPVTSGSLPVAVVTQSQLPQAGPIDRWLEVVPQGPDAMDSASGSVTLVGHQLIVGTLHDAHSKVMIYGLNGKSRDLALPGSGTAAGFGGDPNDKETFYSFVDYITPPTIYRLNLKSGESKLYRAPKPAFDSTQFETKQVFYPSKDGTKIPMYLVSRRGIKMDGLNPTLLYGYGGFGISVLPRFDSTRIAWLEHGGIFAVANLRGGGEYGEEWHRQAILGNKQKVFDDFIAAAEWLIAHKYTSTPKLAIEGGSNGGLLVGACVTQRPDLFGAALAYVGVMDMLRFDQFGQGAGWIGDYGSPQNPEQFKALRAYSPYHNVKPGTRYPPIMVITGDHDARVMPAHSFKFAAALQAAQTGPSPVLLRVRLSTGHGAGPTTSQVIEEKADAYAFLMENLGMQP